MPLAAAHLVQTVFHTSYSERPRKPPSFQAGDEWAYLLGRDGLGPAARFLCVPVSAQTGLPRCPMRERSSPVGRQSLLCPVLPNASFWLFVAVSCLSHNMLTFPLSSAILETVLL